MVNSTKYHYYIKGVMIMLKCNIGIHGCDDSTYVNMEVSKSEAEFLKRLSNLSQKESTYGCMPTIHVEVIES
jgi:hypothetical protein